MAENFFFRHQNGAKREAKWREKVMRKPPVTEKHEKAKIDGQRAKMSELFLINGKRTGAKATAALSNGREFRSR